MLWCINSFLLCQRLATKKTTDPHHQEKRRFPNLNQTSSPAEKTSSSVKKAVLLFRTSELWSWSSRKYSRPPGTMCCIQKLTHNTSPPHRVVEPLHTVTTQNKAPSTLSGRLAPQSLGPLNTTLQERAVALPVPQSLGPLNTTLQVQHGESR